MRPERLQLLGPTIRYIHDKILLNRVEKPNLPWTPWIKVCFRVEARVCCARVDRVQESLAGDSVVAVAKVHAVANQCPESPRIVTQHDLRSELPDLPYER